MPQPVHQLFRGCAGGGSQRRARMPQPMAPGCVRAHRCEFIRELRRETQIPLVLFTYLNPVYTYVFERFHIDAAAAGADGVLILDLPPDEASLNKELIESAGLKHIRLIAQAFAVDVPRHCEANKKPNQPAAERVSGRSEYQWIETRTRTRRNPK